MLQTAPLMLPVDEGVHRCANPRCGFWTLNSWNLRLQEWLQGPPIKIVHALFDANIIGLTGTPEQIAATSETFPIFFERIEEATAPDGYTIGHTSHLFLFDPEAGFADSWPYGTSAEEILADLEERI